MTENHTGIPARDLPLQLLQLPRIPDVQPILHGNQVDPTHHAALKGHIPTKCRLYPVVKGGAVGETVGQSHTRCEFMVARTEKGIVWSKNFLRRSEVAVRHEIQHIARDDRCVKLPPVLHRFAEQTRQLCFVVRICLALKDRPPSARVALHRVAVRVIRQRQMDVGQVQNPNRLLQSEVQFRFPCFQHSVPSAIPMR